MDEIKSELNKVQSSFDPMAPQVEIPMSPTSVIAQVADAGKVIVTWNSVPGATTYNLKRATSSVDPLLIVAMNLTDLSYADSGLEPGKTYHYVVTAQNSAGESGSSEEGVVTLPAEIPAAPPPATSSPVETPAPSATPSPAPEVAPSPGGNGEGVSARPAPTPEAPPTA
jgi:hypothetical protein